MSKLAKYLHELLPIVLLLGSVILFFPTIVFNDHTFISSGMILTDLYLFNYPLKSLLHQSLISGQGIPLWTDLIGNGYPIFAEGQMGPLYPLHLLLYSLNIPTITLFNVNLLIHFGIALICTYLYINKYIKISKSASILGAIVYAFSGYFLTHLHQVNIILVIAYFPLNLLLVEQAFRKSNLRQILTKALVLIAVLFSQLNAGHIEMVYYNLLFTTIYIVLKLVLDKKTRQNAIQGFIIFSVSGAIAITISLPQIIATYELVTFSQREEGLSYEHTTGALWPLETLVLFVNPKAYNVYRDEPGYNPAKAETVNIGALYPYVGIIPLILSCFAIMTLALKNLKDSNTNARQGIVVFSILLIFTYIYAVGRSTQLFAVVWELVPGLKFFRFPIKAIYIIEFSLAVLAAIGGHLLVEKVVKKGINKVEDEGKKNIQTLETSEKNPESIDKVTQPNIGKNAGKNSRDSLSKVIYAMLIIGSFADVWINNRPIQPTISAKQWLSAPEFANYINAQAQEETKIVDPMRRFVNWRSYSHGTNNIDYTRIFDYRLQKDLQNILHVDFNIIHNIAINKEWAVLFLQRQSYLNGQNTQINTEEKYLKFPPTLKRALDLQSVRYLMADLEIRDDSLVKVKTLKLETSVDHVIFMAGQDESTKIPTQELFLYENKNYVPRLQLVPKDSVIYMSPSDKTASNVLNAVLDNNFDPKSQVVIEKDQETATKEMAETDISDPSDPNEIKVTEYSPTRISIATNTQKDSILILNDTYYPGWKASIDGKPTEIYKANYAFRAVGVSAGTHTVEFTFEPTHWQQSTRIALVVLIVYATGCVMVILLNSRSRNQG